MQNTLDYLYWMGSLDLDALPLNELDLFVFSQLSVPDFTGMIGPGVEAVRFPDAIRGLSESDRDWEKALGTFQMRFIPPMIEALRSCRRYDGIRLCHYIDRTVEENDEQFAALTLVLPDESRCISYRGTDDTIVGWKEDFLMACREFIPAQEDALAYLEYVSSFSDAPLYLTGHSKGGNLAAFAAMRAAPSLQARIRKVYNFDGPGFPAAALETPGYETCRERIISISSCNSLVGRIMEEPGIQKIVNTDVKGPRAHDGFTWEAGPEGFVPAADGLSETSREFEKVVDQILRNLSVPERELVVNDIFDAILGSEIETVTDLTEFNLQRSIAIFRELGKNKETHKVVLKILDTMFQNFKDSQAWLQPAESRQNLPVPAGKKEPRTAKQSSGNKKKKEADHAVEQAKHS